MAVKSDDEQFVFFYGKDSPFSQHHHATFHIDGVQFNCSEQYMMYSKAVLFRDDEMKEKILATSNPVEQKKFGRRVQNFEKDVWDKKCEEIVKAANLAKFAQNKDLQEKLFATHPKTLVEASPRDNIWGIGLGASNPKAKNRSQWRGKNKLGFILTEVRDTLMKDSESDAESS